MAAPAPTPFLVKRYEASDDVETLHGFHRDDDLEFGSEEHGVSLIFTFAVAVAVPLVLILLCYLWACIAQCKCVRHYCCGCCFQRSKLFNTRLVVLTFIICACTIAGLLPANIFLQEAAGKMVDSLTDIGKSLVPPRRQNPTSHLTVFP